MQWMVWHSVHLFSVCEQLGVPSIVKGLHSSYFLHGSNGCALHCAKCGSEAYVLYLVQFVRVALGCCSPCTCSVFKRWSHIQCTVCDAPLPSVCQRAASVGLVSGCPFFSLTQSVVSMRGGSLVWLNNQYFSFNETSRRVCTGIEMPKRSMNAELTYQLDI